MQNRWNASDHALHNTALAECVYGSRLLGSEAMLVLHGGGNTSVKTRSIDVTGATIDVIHVKGSGRDLATIEPEGFASLRLDRVRALVSVEQLSDRQMMNELRCALLDASSPDPSVESLLHALLPAVAVLHTHADAIIALTNLTNGEQVIREVYGDDVVVVPYVMPGFDLAKRCAQTWLEQAHADIVGIVLLNHGLFTFGASTAAAYDSHIDLVSRAEAYLDAHRAPAAAASHGRPLPAVSPVELAELRREISTSTGVPMVVIRHCDKRTADFVARPDLPSVAQQGPATPDHVIRTKRLPMIGRDVAGYTEAYREYFAAHAGRRNEPLIMLDPAPRIVLDPDLGMLAIGRRAKDADIAGDIYTHTMSIVEDGERLGGYRALPACDIFDVEYWDLEQAKLLQAGEPPELTGQIALVTGSASGIGRACAGSLLARGACVVGLDIAESAETTFTGPEWLGVRVDVTDPAAVAAALGRGVERFGGIDLLVIAAGIFPAGQPIADLDQTVYGRTMSVNVDAAADLLRQTHPLLALAPRGGRVVLIASKNVAAPGPGAGAYSVSKAAATQLARVAALEWAGDGIRVNIVHPDAVFDTGLWTEELLAERAERYGISVAQYKRRNLLHAEVTSAGVARLVVEMCSDTFQFTTGAQVSVDGGNERVI